MQFSDLTALCCSVMLRTLLLWSNQTQPSQARPTAGSILTYSKLGRLPLKLGGLRSTLNRALDLLHILIKIQDTNPMCECQLVCTFVWLAMTLWSCQHISFIRFGRYWCKQWDMLSSTWRKSARTNFSGFKQEDNVVKRWNKIILRHIAAGFQNKMAKNFNLKIRVVMLWGYVTRRNDQSTGIFILWTVI